MNTTTTPFRPAVLNQLLTVRAGQVLAERLPEIAGLVTVTGQLSDPGQARGKWHYGVRITEDGERIHADIPAALIASRQLRAGQVVRVTGAVNVRAGQMGVLEVRLVASDVVVADGVVGVAASQPRSHLMTIEDIKRLEMPRYPFPVPNGPLQIVLIQSGSLHAQVSEDCMGELSKLGSMATIRRVPINMLDPNAIAEALRQARGHVVMMIRGGGDAADFEVFDDRRVVEALAAVKSHRVIGLGHSGNATLLDLVADHSARTPAQAGLYVREAVERIVAAWRTDRERPVAAESRAPNLASRLLPWLLAGLGFATIAYFCVS